MGRVVVEVRKAVGSAEGPIPRPCVERARSRHRNVKEVMVRVVVEVREAWDPPKDLSSDYRLRRARSRHRNVKEVMVRVVVEVRKRVGSAAGPIPRLPTSKSAKSP